MPSTKTLHGFQPHENINYTTITHKYTYPYPSKLAYKKQTFDVKLEYRYTIDSNKHTRTSARQRVLIRHRIGNI